MVSYILAMEHAWWCTVISRVNSVVRAGSPRLVLRRFGTMLEDVAYSHVLPPASPNSVNTRFPSPVSDIGGLSTGLQHGLGREREEHMVIPVLGLGRWRPVTAWSTPGAARGEKVSSRLGAALG